MNSKEIRDEFFKELTSYVRSSRQEEKSKWDIFNKPIFITLIGTVLITGLTLFWEASESKRSQEFLIRQF